MPVSFSRDLAVITSLVNGAIFRIGRSFGRMLLLALPGFSPNAQSALRSSVFTAPPSLLRSADDTAPPSVHQSPLFIAPPSASLTASHARVAPLRCSSELARANDPVPTAGVLSGGKRSFLRAQGKHLSSLAVADVSSAAAEIERLLQGELDECKLDAPSGTACSLGRVGEGNLLRCEFVAASGKSEAVGLAMELAAITGSALAECVGTECLLYKPSPAA